MLQSLHVHNFALLEDARADFSRGFNVFTGETGAGKSILIDAFGAVLGGRASAGYVRSGTDGLWVQAVFDISGQQDIKDFLEEHGLEADDDLFIRRQISAAGKSRAYLNGVQVPLAVLKQLGQKMVDIHGQHENQALLKPEAARELTDAFGGGELQDALQAYGQLYAEYTGLSGKLAQLEKDSGSREILLDRCQWEIKEISAARLQPGEQEALEEEAAVLAHSEKITGAVSRAYALLDEDRAVLSQLAQAREQLQYALRYDSRLQPLYDGLDSAWISLDDCRGELSDYLSSNEFNGERAAEVQERLDTISRLLKKYGGSVESALAYLQKAEARRSELLNIEEAAAKARAELDAAVRKLKTAAAALTAARKKSAAGLSARITEHIRDLAMLDGVFRIEIEPLEGFAPSGCDSLKFMFSANAGEPVRELEKVASGGELSRIALAVKTVLMNTGSVGTMVFDEIDTGVGGVTARKMAEKIAAISLRGQVLCITHLPQIAAFADNHIHIEKENAGGRTVTVLTVLDRDGRIAELMRMTAGDSRSKAASDNAAELLAAADRVKEKLKK